MALPSKLKHFNVFLDGLTHAGEVEEFTLPKLTRKVEEYRAGGMNGPVELDLGNEKLEVEATYGGLMRSVLKQYGTTTVDGALIRFAGAYQRVEAGRIGDVHLILVVGVPGVVVGVRVVVEVEHGTPLAPGAGLEAHRCRCLREQVTRVEQHTPRVPVRVRVLDGV